MYYANETFLSNKLTIANNLKNNDMFNIDALNYRFNSHSKKQFNFAYAYSQILVSNISKLTKGTFRRNCSTSLTALPSILQYEY